MNKRTITAITIISGLSIAFLGFGLHCINPSIISSTHFGVEPDQDLIKHFKIQNSFSNPDYTLNFRLNSLHEFTLNQCAVYILREPEYEIFANGSIQIEELTQLIDLGDNFEANSSHIKGEYTFNSREPINFYIIFLNRSPNSIHGFLYVGIIPTTYYVGIMISIIAIIVALGGLIITFTGFKRHFTLGIGVNLVIFLIRIATLGDYNGIGIQASYLNDIVTPEMYNDFEFWYLSWIEPFLDGNFPYSGGHLGEIIGYEMPPLFLIILSLFSLIPLIPIWKVGIPILLSHIGIGILVFLITRRITDQEHVATKSMLFYYFNPISLVYANFCLLNPPVFVFFLLLSFYLAQFRNNDIEVLGNRISGHDLALLILGIATMIKQFAAIFLPLIFITIIKEKEIRDFKQNIAVIKRGLFIYMIPIIIVITPFFIIDFQAVWFSTIQTTTSFSIGFTKFVADFFPVNFNTFFVAFGFPIFFTDLIGILIVYWILLVVTALTTFYFYWKTSDKITKKVQNYNGNLLETSLQKIIERNTLFWAFVLVFCVNFFYPRGVFKFYWILLMPFLAILLVEKRGFGYRISQSEFLCIKNENLKSLLTVLPTYVFLLILVLINRNIYFILLLMWLLYILKEKTQEIKKFQS
jgi:hypothetical protein